MMVRIQPWMHGFLLVAGIYNLAWGLFIYVFPKAFFRWLTASQEAADQLVVYQGIGVLMFGILYILTALWPVRFWYLALTGLLSKVFGGMAVYFFIVDKTVTKQFIFHLLVNDLAWVTPLAFITYRAFKLHKHYLYEKAA
ncbi:hypothetical protein [Nafulsella turpanensis]|uniref:hypothetical protein n=1 Tax=Nafulsella turpanensis TaxID=1265690 RepID=UPI000369851E|nr:hypothetical protein [Nafulsella turpanensis]